MPSPSALQRQILSYTARCSAFSVSRAHLNDGGKEGTRSDNVSDHNPLQAEDLGDLAHDLVPRQHPHKVGQRLCAAICIAATSELSA